MNIYLHITLVALIVGFSAWRFVRTRYAYMLCIILLALSTLFNYLSDDKAILRTVGIIQLVLFFITLLLTMRTSKKNTRAQLEKLLESEKTENGENND